MPKTQLLLAEKGVPFLFFISLIKTNHGQGNGNGFWKVLEYAHNHRPGLVWGPLFGPVYVAQYWPSIGTVLRALLCPGAGPVLAQYWHSAGTVLAQY